MHFKTFFFVVLVCVCVVARKRTRERVCPEACCPKVVDHAKHKACNILDNDKPTDGRGADNDLNSNQNSPLRNLQIQDKNVVVSFVLFLLNAQVMCVNIYFYFKVFSLKLFC